MLPQVIAMTSPTGEAKLNAIAINNTAYSTLRSIRKCSCRANTNPIRKPTGNWKPHIATFTQIAPIRKYMISLSKYPLSVSAGFFPGFAIVSIVDQNSRGCESNLSCAYIRLSSRLDTDEKRFLYGPQSYEMPDEVFPLPKHPG